MRIPSHPDRLVVEPRRRRTLEKKFAIIFGTCLLTLHCAFAQGTLEDYQRAQRFLPGNLRHIVFVADIEPHWIEKTNRFWYRRIRPEGIEFILVDADKNTVAPAFDQTELAKKLSQVSNRQYEALDLPFTDIEFVDDGQAIRFQIENLQWTCQLSTYKCEKNQSPENPSVVLSPNKRWAAYVKDHNLYLRDVVTGTIVQLTEDGVSGWDYATPLPSLRLLVDQGKQEAQQPAAVFWSADSAKLITYIALTPETRAGLPAFSLSRRTSCALALLPMCILSPEKCWPRHSRSFLTFSRVNELKCKRPPWNFRFRTARVLIGFQIARVSTTTTTRGDTRRRSFAWLTPQPENRESLSASNRIRMWILEKRSSTSPMG